jgi:hypothetical protein
MSASLQARPGATSRISLFLLGKQTAVIKLKVKLSLCLAKHDATKMYLLVN